MIDVCGTLPTPAEITAFLKDGDPAKRDKLIDRLGQPASYFALRNDFWQLLGMDTGLHDSQPGGGLTYLENSEIEWLRDKLDNLSERAKSE
jgi:hypothetical protein